MISKPGDDRRNHYTCGNSCAPKLFDRIEPGGKPEIFVRWPCVAVNAPVLAAAIRVEACFEAYIRAAIASDNRFGSIAKILRCAPGLLLCVGIDVDDIDVR